MDALHYVSAVIGICWLIGGAIYLLFYPSPPRRFPRGHIRTYDPTGEYVYSDQNPRFKENNV